MTAIDDKYAALVAGGLDLGPPTGPEQPAAMNGFWREYQQGAIFYHPNVGAFETHGAIWAKYQQLGREAGFLGYPTTDETATPPHDEDSPSIGRYNHFQGGSVYWTSRSGAHEVHGPIRDAWADLGWERGLGYPTTDQTSAVSEYGVEYNSFTRGRIALDPTDPTRAFAWRAGDPALLVVSSAAAWTDAVRPLLQHKRRTGMPALLHQLPARRPGAAAYGAAANLKRQIYQAVKSFGVRYVLLLGDASLMPVIYRCTTLEGGDWAQRWFTSADLYYANLFEHVLQPNGELLTILDRPMVTWDANRNQRYNEHHWADDAVSWNPDKVDGIPDVAIGRLPAHDVSDVTTYVNKVIAFERTPATGRQGVTVVLDRDYDGLGMAQRAIEIGRVEERFGPVDILAEDWPPEAVPPAPMQRATPWALQQAAADSAWLFYVGHGWNDGWDINDGGRPFDSERVSEYRNARNLPVVFAAGCSTGQHVANPPKLGEYRGLDGHRHLYIASGGTDDGTRTRVDHYVDTAPPAPPTESWTGTPVAPVDVALPASLVDPTTRSTSVANSWLFNPNGGAIAYFGETTVAQNNWGCEVLGRILSNYGGVGSVLGEMYIRGQRAYASDFAAEQGPIGAPRIYLTYVHLFGDPSLRLW